MVLLLMAVGGPQEANGDVGNFHFRLVYRLCVPSDVLLKRPN